MQAPPEQLGSFYLGASMISPASAARRPSLRRPRPGDPRGLRRHDRQRQDRPVHRSAGRGGPGQGARILIDPKGDITNLLLQFPDLQPGRFPPWINADDARAQGQTVEEFAQSHRRNLAQGAGRLGQGGDRIRMLKDTWTTRSSPPARMRACRSAFWAAWPHPSSDWNDRAEASASASRHGGGAAGAGRRQRRPGAQPRGHPALHHLRAFLAQGQDLDLAKLIWRFRRRRCARWASSTWTPSSPPKDRFAWRWPSTRSSPRPLSRSGCRASRSM
jgi:hypothetical protein